MMKKIILCGLATLALCCSCNTSKSGAKGITDTEIFTINNSINDYDLEVDSEGVTYTIDISTNEGKLKLKGLSLEEAQNLALQEAAIKYNCARIISPKFSHLKQGKEILRITVFGFPARYKQKK